jgi:hypothetical protein
VIMIDEMRHPQHMWIHYCPGIERQDRWKVKC